MLTTPGLKDTSETAMATATEEVIKLSALSLNVSVELPNLPINGPRQKQLLLEVG